MRKILVTTGALPIVVGLALAGLTSLASAQAGPTTWTVWAGFAATETGRPPQAPNEIIVLSNDFQPRPLEILVGDSVDFRNGGFHTVAIGRDRLPFALSLDPFVPNPDVFFPSGGNVYDGTGVVSSGIMEGPQTFSVTFSRAGEYQVLCDIHALALPDVGMAMTVRVKPAGEPLARTPQQALGEAIQHFLGDFTNRALPLIARGATVEVAQVDGRWAYQVAAGFGDGHVEGTRFLPRDLVVRAGDWVSWVNPDPDAPHTVTLLPAGDMMEHPEALLEQAFAPFGGNVYDGTAMVNVPVMAAPHFRLPGVTDRGIIQFTTPGEYHYFCIFHADLGMEGMITVLPT